jgi:hypothetical protein
MCVFACLLLITLWLFIFDWLLRYVIYLIFVAFRTAFVIWLNSCTRADFPPFFWKFIDFGNFLSLTTSLDKFSSTAFATGIIHERERKIVETLSSVHAFYDIERIFDLGRRTQNSVQSVYLLNLCEYDIHGIKLLSVKLYTFIRLLKSICACK